MIDCIWNKQVSMFRYLLFKGTFFEFFDFEPLKRPLKGNTLFIVFRKLTFFFVTFSVTFVLICLTTADGLHGSLISLYCHNANAVAISFGSIFVSS